MLASAHHELSIFIYSLITTGLNSETVMNWKWRINNKPWYKNYDVCLGITDESTQRDKSILLVGKKHKGQGASKLISTSININSPLFNYLKFLDKTRPKDREHIFTINDTSPKLQSFAHQYSIIGDDGNVLNSIETKRLRKVFAGHKLISLLKNVKSGDVLIIHPDDRTTDFLKPRDKRHSFLIIKTTNYHPIYVATLYTHSPLSITPI